MLRVYGQQKYVDSYTESLNKAPSPSKVSFKVISTGQKLF